MHKCLYCNQSLSSGDFHPTCAKKIFGRTEVPTLLYELNEIEELARKTISHSIAVTGVQRKLSLHLDNNANHDSRFTIVGLWGNYILKPPTKEYPFMPEVEQCTMELAKLFKIPVVPHSLIRLSSGELCYITRRIDRNQKTGQPIHMEDFCQLSGKLTEQKYHGSMEHAAKVIQAYSSNALFDLIRYFELSLFSFITGNTDMHLKNFSLLHNENNLISLSPAYDLLCTRLFISEKDDAEELALTLNGKKRKLKKEDFFSFGKTIGLSDKQIETSLKNALEAEAKIKPVIESSFIPQNMQTNFIKIIGERYERLR